MSPQVRKKKAYTFSAEVWSVGVLIFQILAGILNTDKFNPQLGVFSFPFVFPSLAKDVILKMLNKNPESRPNFAQVLKMPFFGQYSKEQVKAQASMLSKPRITKVGMQRTSLTQNVLQLQAEEAGRLKAEEKLQKAEIKIENLNLQIEQLTSQLTKKKTLLNVTNKRYEKLKEQYQVQKNMGQKLKKQNQGYIKKLKSMNEKLSELLQIQEELQESKIKVIKLKDSLNVAISERDQQRHSSTTKEQQLILQKIKTDDLRKQLQNCQLKYYALQKTITGGAGLSTFDNLKTQATLSQTQEELQVKSRTSLQKYFQSRMHQIQSQVGDVRKSISNINLSQKQYCMERQSHIDFNQKRLKQIDAKLEVKKQLDQLTLQNKSLKAEVERFKMANAQFQKEEQVNFQSISRLTKDNSKLKDQQEEIKSLRNRVNNADDQLACKESWMQILRKQIDDLEFQLQYQKSRTTGATIINEQHFSISKLKDEKKKKR